MDEIASLVERLRGGACTVSDHPRIADLIGSLFDAWTRENLHRQIDANNLTTMVRAMRTRAGFSVDDGIGPIEIVDRLIERDRRGGEGA